LAVEASLIGPPIIKMMDKGVSWQGTASGRLKELESNHSDEKMTKHKEWPADGRKLSGELRRLAPNLRKLGIDVIFGERDTSRMRRRLITLERCCNTPSAPSTSSETTENIGPAPGRCADGADDAQGGDRPAPDPENYHTSDDTDGADGVLQPFSKQMADTKAGSWNPDRF
jgi:hypothetical protein